MNFKRYQHVERYETVETKGIEEGVVYVFPKLDGSNGSVWRKGNELKCGSRNRELSLDDDNQGFMKAILEDERFANLLLLYPDWRLFGEWLIPHSLKTYRKTAWRKFYVFDVYGPSGVIHYNDYAHVLREFEIEFIPPLCRIEDAKPETLYEMCEKNTYLIDEGIGEGVVLKNYSYQNKYGRQTWAKIVRNEFKDKHRAMNDPLDIKEKLAVEKKITDKYITPHFVQKVYEKIRNAEDGWRTKYIPRLLNTVYYDLIREESWNFIKENKDPQIDYKQLKRHVIMKVKKSIPELF